MRRSLTSTVAVFAIVAQLALGVSANLGLVLCIGDDHAAIELASDDCCASHGNVGGNRVASLERDCCSDIPLYTATRPLSDMPRAFAWLVSGPGLPAASTMAATGDDVPLPLAVAAAPPPSLLVRRSTVLRV